MPAEVSACVGGSVRKLERLWGNLEVATFTVLGLPLFLLKNS